MTENDEQNIICNKCHNAILRESLVIYLTCDKTMKKMFTLKFDMEKYSSLENTILEMLKSNRINCYICKSSHLQLQPKCACVCCNTDVHNDICKMYNKAGYDFTSFVVSQCLGHVSNPANNEDQYICASCDKRLQETSNENPVLPYYGKYPHAVAGANFLKALNQRPEYVCTCCHHLLFHKTVWLRHTTDYDMSDETVKECLSHRYVMKLHRHTSHENDEIRTSKWQQFDVEHDDIYIMDEFICIHCRNSLWQKKNNNAWPGMCKWSAVTWHPTGFTKHISTGEKSNFSTNSIHNNTCHEMIWWPLQSKWSTCQCSSNTRWNYRNIALHA